MMDDLPIYVMERDFAAPQTLVWQAWTDPALFSRWYGPGAETRVAECDLRPGGRALVEMRWGDKAQFQRFDYTIVAAPTHLAFVQVTADANWTKAPVPHQPDWPQQLMTDVTLSANGSKTHMLMTWAPHDCSAAEIAMFRSAMAGLGRGWGAGMQLLDQVLADLQR